MNDSVKIFVRMLSRAYRYEDAEQEIISETLLQLSNDHLWDVMFGIMRDNEAHKRIIESIVENLNYSVEDFTEYSIKKVDITTYDFSDDMAVEMLNELLKYEVWTKKYYQHMLNHMEPEALEGVDEILIRKIRETLEQLVKWETIHIQKLTDLKRKI